MKRAWVSTVGRTTGLLTRSIWANQHQENWPWYMNCLFAFGLIHVTLISLTVYSVDTKAILWRGSLMKHMWVRDKFPVPIHDWSITGFDSQHSYGVISMLFFWCWNSIPLDISSHDYCGKSGLASGMLLEEKKGHIWNVYSTDHGDFNGNMSGAKAVKLDGRLGSSRRIISQP